MNSPIWLDLELREDIDDILTLIYAIESKANIKAISINNPSENELKLLKGVLDRFNLSLPVYMTGEITRYEPGKDVIDALTRYMSNSAVEPVNLSDAPLSALEGAYTVFCGGSLTTLAELSEVNSSISAVVQGGFASYKLVPEGALLKKFKKREKVPTWNLNLDLDATDKVLSSNISIRFVSKNICHSAFVSDSDLTTESVMAEVFNNYLSTSEYNDKCLHDVLAFMAIESPEIFTFKPVKLLRTNDERPKWWSKFDSESKRSISVDYDKGAFLNMLNMPN